MEETQTYVSPYKQLFDETEDLSIGKLILGFVISTLILLGSTWGLLTLLNIAGMFSLDPASFGRYTIYLLAASVGSVVFALILCGILIKWPRTVSLPLLIHRRAKHHAGDYFMSPDPDDENLGDAFRRSIYGSVLLVGIALTILGFEMIGDVGTIDIINLGSFLMVVSVVILPFTVMLLYFGPWLMREAGLFHLDAKDRSLSNVGDDVEDILEFFAGVDLVLVWIEITINVGLEAPWVPIFIILVALGPLFAIILNFTLVFVFVKKRATLSMMRYISERYDVPDMATSPTYIRSQVMALVERELFMTVPATPVDMEAPSETEVVSELEPDSESEPEPEPDPTPEAAPEPKRDSIPPPPRDHIPPPPGGHIPPPPSDDTESVPEDDD
jgi:hypothetical protein